MPTMSFAEAVALIRSGICPQTLMPTRACTCGPCRDAYAPRSYDPNGPGSVHDMVVNRGLRPIVLGESIVWVPI